MSPDASARVEREIFLRSLMFATPPASMTQALIEIMQDVTLSAGSVLFSAGTAPTEFYFVISGQVEMRAEGEAPWRFEDRSVVGILDVMRHAPRARTAVALSPVRALMVPGEPYFDILEDNFDFVCELLARLAGQLNELSESLSGPERFDAPARGEAVAPVDEPEAAGLVERLVALRASSFYQTMPMQALVRLAGLGEVRALAPGEALLEAGAPTRDFYVCLAGELALEPEGRSPCPFPPRAAVAVTFSLAECPAPAPLRATEPSLVLVIQREDLFDTMEDHFEVVRALLAWHAIERSRLMKAKAEQPGGLSEPEAKLEPRGQHEPETKPGLRAQP